MICKYCNSNIKSDFRYCPNCGERIVSAFADQYEDLQPPYVISPTEPIEHTLDDIRLPGDVQYTGYTPDDASAQGAPLAGDTSAKEDKPGYTQEPKASSEYREGFEQGAPDNQPPSYSAPDFSPEAEPQYEEIPVYKEPAENQTVYYAQEQKPYFVYNPDPPPTREDFFVPQPDQDASYTRNALSPKPVTQPSYKSPNLFFKLFTILLMVAFGSIAAYIGYGLAMGYVLWPPYFPF